MSVEVTPFGVTPAGELVERFVCANERGSRLELLSFGATLAALCLPDRSGELLNVVLGCDTLDAYLAQRVHLGACVGRYANRIAGARFTLDGDEFRLAANEGRNQLHGGPAGLGRLVWRAEALSDRDAVGVRFDTTSPDGDQGFPGSLHVAVEIRLSHEDRLTFDYEAEADRETVVNLTNHAYWNLAGRGSVLAHELELHADFALEVDDEKLPTGAFLPVRGGPLDFSRPRAIGEGLRALGAGESIPGYDRCYALRGWDGSLARGAALRDPTTGRAMEVWTSEPGIQLYTGNGLDGSPASGGHTRYAGLCLEAQHFPDSPNRPDFPSTILRPGEIYTQTTEHRFEIA